MKKIISFDKELEFNSIVGDINSIMKMENYKPLKERGASVVINSNKELSAIYTGDEEIPKIDFSKISIILCHSYISSSAFKYESFSLKNSKNETLVTLNFKLSIEPGMYYTGPVDYYFFKVVPKFEPGKTIRAEVNYIKN